MKDIVYIENSYNVSVREFGFRFYNFIDKKELFFTFDDVETFIFDNQKCYLSTSFINACIDRNINIIVKDIKHNPVVDFVSLKLHRNRLSRLQSQIMLSQKSKNRIWKKIVVAKIRNQARCLEYCTQNKEDREFLMDLARNVNEADKENREAVAARFYFSRMFGKSFVRGRYSDAVNAGLNYGYAIIRSNLKRELTIHGFEMSLGVHHRSSENPYNLADDLIEVFRPFVDMFVYEYIYKQGSSELTILHKKQLIEVLMEKCVIDEKVCSVSDSMTVLVQSLIGCLEKNSAGLLMLPSMQEAGR
ncbi:type II CRISPR-associated endonuclease Cas1 [Macrococcoides caseolyticum]|uniref:type II CRISPR-associated endonuclease Cas1 n=1 Tax=Macrococcoides caseolyticum TaxID=69966 RepID=UPI00106110A9|nr:type II CRISPR-associated endonuclease Cas1 [Macrococcus caseolyticus]TDM26797.1 type II CRISPR-associated endonuclease Cas1 [Macrococcus caseolyticus]